MFGDMSAVCAVFVCVCVYLDIRDGLDELNDRNASSAA